MGDMVIVAFRPKPGRADALLALVREHVPTLRALGLATDRRVIAMRSRDGVIVEVFEWQAGAIARAHENPDVQALWARFTAVSDHVRLADLPETQDLFARFTPLELPA